MAKFIPAMSILLALVAGGCASLQSVSVTQVPAHRERMVEEEVHDWSFLGIHFSNDFVDGLRDRLKAQCPGGKISGILTKYETRLYVLFVKRAVIATGYCEPAPSASTSEALETYPALEGA